MNLHSKTIDKCERLYSTKADAYFHGMLGGVLLTGVAVLLAIGVAWLTTR